MFCERVQGVNLSKGSIIMELFLYFCCIFSMQIRLWTDITLAGIALHESIEWKIL